MDYTIFWRKIDLKDSVEKKTFRAIMNDAFKKNPRADSFFAIETLI